MIPSSAVRLYQGSTIGAASSTISYNVPTYSEGYTSTQDGPTAYFRLSYGLSFSWLGRVVSGRPCQSTAVYSNGDSYQGSACNNDAVGCHLLKTSTADG